MLILLTDFLINSFKVSYENMAVYQDFVLILTVRTLPNVAVAPHVLDKTEKEVVEVFN